MFALGLTGSMATGKSTVLQAFADLGIPVYSADQAVHDAYAAEAVAPVEAAFPGVTRRGMIDRAALAERLVARPDRIAELEEIVHPLVRARMRRFLEDAAGEGADIAVLEIPLLFETGADYPVDAVAVTWCSSEEQRRRALARPGMNVEKFERLLARQMPQSEKKERADYLIGTDQSLEETRAEVKRIVEAIRKQKRAP